MQTDPFEILCGGTGFCANHPGAMKRNLTGVWLVVFQTLMQPNEPAHEIIVPHRQPAKGSGEPAHPYSLTRAFAVRTHEVYK